MYILALCLMAYICAIWNHLHTHGQHGVAIFEVDSHSIQYEKRLVKPTNSFQTPLQFQATLCTAKTKLQCLS